MNIPTGKKIWGDYTIESWSLSDQRWFNIWIDGAAASMFFTEQKTINRVTEEVASIIKQAKAGEIKSKDAISRVRFKSIFSKEERDAMEEQAKKIGHIANGGTACQC
jgi:hypothetical protein